MRTPGIFLLMIVGLLAGSSCSDKKAVPSDILPREAMQNVLWDMIQADQFTSYIAKDSNKVNLKLEDLRLYEQVFQLHHVSREDFSKSYKYYMAHPELSQTLFDSLLAMGNRLRTEAYSRPVNRPVTPPVVAPALKPETKPATVLPVRPGIIPPAKAMADSLRKKQQQAHPRILP